MTNETSEGHYSKELKEKTNLTDFELDELLKQAMRDEGYTTFINYQGEEEAL